jgi:hypothetical protein
MTNHIYYDTILCSNNKGRKLLFILSGIKRLGGNMDFDFKKEEQKYLDALKAGEYYIELNPNKGVDHQLKEQRDLDAFKEDLKSENFKSLVAEALG